MAQIKFVAKISSQGDALTIWIPKDLHPEALKMKGKQVKIVIDDVI